MDLRIHAGSMDEAQAMELMVEGGFQEEGEAANKWDRARLSSTQLCEYFLGSIGMHDLEADARRRAAEAQRRSSCIARSWSRCWRTARRRCR